MNETDSTVTAFSFLLQGMWQQKRKGGDGMKRNVDLNEISDGRLYSANDMVKVECGDCAGCSACCSEYGNFGCFRSDGYMENATRNRQDVGETSEKRTGAECCGWNYFAQSAYERNERGLFLSE